LSTSGILNVDKPADWTSFRVVSTVRRLSGIRRVGHAGTLDPFATGVLLVCLGQATRLTEYLIQATKLYRAEVHLGAVTDTFDATGTLLRQGDASAVSSSRIEHALTTFQGEIEQVPPMFSALKHGGEPLYRYARAGQPVERPARLVTIHRIQLLGFEPPVATIEVECGKGTYIRTLAYDLGERLGCGAHLSGLVRLRVGSFTLENACPVADLETAFQEGRWQVLLHPPDAALPDWPAITLSEEEVTTVRFGQALPAAELRPSSPWSPEPGQLCRAYSPQGELLAVLRYEAAADIWRPIKVLTAPEKAQ
jgi:tRNA pseudouridine55 synthase